MEMPTPCEHCGEWFDLNDGYQSDKWHPDTIICSGCGYKEEKEIEEDEYWENTNIEISNALYGINEKENAWSKLDKENQEVISKLFESKKVQ